MPTLTNSLSLGPEHHLFTLWAKEQGVQFGNVRPAKLPGRGLGIIADQHIKGGEHLISVPVSALFSIESIPRGFRSLHTGISVQGILASFLASGFADHHHDILVWREMWPSMNEFRQTMPLLWPRILTHSSTRDSDGLPAAIGIESSRLLDKQSRKLRKDWDVVKKVVPNVDYDKYVYNWLVVNTRSFYYEPPNERKPKSRDDCMALCPLADCFNHADEGASVAFDENGFIFTSDRDYAAGEEIFISYGSHSNDVLLTEYGFILETGTNRWDSARIDSIVESLLDSTSKAKLRAFGYFGNYNLDENGVCYRTQIAIRTQTLNELEWETAVKGQETSIDQRKDIMAADALIVTGILDNYYSKSNQAMSYLNQDFDNLDSATATLQKRWSQIRLIIKKTLATHIEPQARSISTAWKDLSR